MLVVRKNTSFAIAIMIWGAALACPEAAQGVPNVTNGGFENAVDFSSWAVQRAFVGSFLVCATDPAGAHSGDRYAQFAGHENQYDAISKTFATTPGESYGVSFWLRSDNIAPSYDSFLVLWDGQIIFELSNPQNGFPYTQHHLMVTATGASSELMFLGYKRFGSFCLDDVSLTLPPASDLCADAPRVYPGEYIGDTTESFVTRDVLASCELDSPDIADVWYRYVPPCDQTLTLSMCGSEITANLSVWQGSCDNLQEVACNAPEEPTCSDGSVRPVLEVSVVEGGVYYFRIARFINDPTGSYRLLISTSPSAPNNDYCQGAINLLAGMAYNGRTSCATGEGYSTCGLSDHDVWYRYTPKCDHLLELDTCGSNTDTSITVFDGNCGNLVEIACDDAGAMCGGAPGASVSAPVEAGQQYRIRVASIGAGSGGNFTLNVAAPEGAACATAQPVFDGANAYDGACSLISTGYNCAGETFTNGHWFSYTATETGPVQILMCAAAPGTLSVFHGVCSDLTCLGESAVPPFTCPTLHPVLGFEAFAGETYFVSYATSTDRAWPTGVGTIYFVPSVPNDDCADAILLGANDEVTGSTASATPGGSASSCGGIGKDVWYKYQPDCNHTLELDTCGSSSATKLTVYEGDCGAAQEIACNNDADSCADPNSPRVAVDVYAGETYLIRVAALAGDVGGDFVVRTGPIARHQNCANAMPIYDGVNAFDGRCSNATSGRNCSGTTQTQSVWFSYTATHTGPVTLELCTAAASISFTVFEGSCGGLDCIEGRSFTPAPCPLSNPALAFETVEGQTYRICLAQGLPLVPVGPGEITVVASRPANDNCAEAEPVFLGDAPFDNTGATNDGPADCFGSAFVKDLWYRYVADASGQLSIGTCGDDSVDTLLAVYRGDCATSEQLACSNDDCPNGSQASVTLPVQEGDELLIRVGSILYDRGPGVLTLDLTPWDCPGDLDGDLDVDLADVARFQVNYGRTNEALPTDGDMDQDQDIDTDDWTYLAPLLGSRCTD